MTFRNLCTSLALALFFSSSVPGALAQSSPTIDITIPGPDDAQFEDAQLDIIAEFLRQNRIVDRCLRNRNKDENAVLTAYTAACMTFRVFETPGKKSRNQSDIWNKAQEVELIRASLKPNSQIKGIEFLKMIFEAAGVTVSPLSSLNYDEDWDKLTMKMTDAHKKILYTAYENGIMPFPRTRQAALDQRDNLIRRPLTISEGLAYLYQMGSAHETPTVTIEQLNVGSGLSTNFSLQGVLEIVIDSIRKQSYYADSFREQEAVEAAIRAVIDTLEDDEYIEYFSPEQYKNFNTGLNGELEGIGAFVDEIDDKIIVVSPVDGSPAQAAGLKAGDIITHVDGESTEGQGLKEVVRKIRGPKGSVVTLGIIRNETETFSVDITRGQITIPSVTSEEKQGIHIIKLVQFGQDSSFKLKNEFESVLKKNPQGIIIDLRNNPGGYLTEVMNMLDLFLPKGVESVVLKDVARKSPLLTSNDIQLKVKGIPMAVLINKGSASASEILAGALKAHNIAKIYGETSFGKGTVQNIMTINDPLFDSPAAFKLTTSEYLIADPNGEAFSINKTGVKPVDNPGGAEVPILDDSETTTVDEAIEAVIRELKK